MLTACFAIIHCIIDHPDREQYKQYEEQWKQYEVQMDTQKAELAKRRQTVLSKHGINVKF